MNDSAWPMVFAIELLLAITIIGIVSCIIWLRSKRDTKNTTAPELTQEEIRASIEKLRYTDQLMKLIELMVQRSTVFHFYQQIGKLPLANFTAAMQETMISDIARETYEALDLDLLSSRSVFSSYYLNRYIINTAIVTVDCTLTDLIDGDMKLSDIASGIDNSKKGDM